MPAESFVRYSAQRPVPAAGARLATRRFVSLEQVRLRPVPLAADPFAPSQVALPLWPARADGPAMLAGRSVIVAELGGRSLSTLAVVLRRAGAAVEVVQTLGGARRSAALIGPHAVVIVDAMPSAPSLRDGLDALHRQDAVIVLAAGATSAERVALLHNGADQVLGRADADELMAALCSVLRRVERLAVVQAPDTLCCGPITVHRSTRTAVSAGQVLVLTALEFNLLSYFVSHVGEVLSRERLLGDVWGYDVGGLDTVTVHVRRLRCKIEMEPSRPVLLQTVWGVGYKMAAGGALSLVPAER